MTLRLFRLADWKMAPCSYQWSTDGSTRTLNRIGSGRWVDSTFTTSAPREARYWVAMGPPRKAVKSRIRRPARGSPSGSGSTPRTAGNGRSARRAGWARRWGGPRGPPRQVGAGPGRGPTVALERRATRMGKAAPGVRVIEVAEGHLSMSGKLAPFPMGTVGIR